MDSLVLILEQKNKKLSHPNQHNRLITAATNISHMTVLNFNYSIRDTEPCKDNFFIINKRSDLTNETLKTDSLVLAKKKHNSLSFPF